MSISLSHKIDTIFRTDKGAFFNMDLPAGFRENTDSKGKKSDSRPEIRENCPHCLF